MANANLKTIAVRFPKNNNNKKIIKKIKISFSYSKCKYIKWCKSCKSFTDVFDEFGKKINFILDGGTTKIGLESTVINLTWKNKILRPGAISHKIKLVKF